MTTNPKRLLIMAGIFNLIGIIVTISLLVYFASQDMKRWNKPKKQPEIKGNVIKGKVSYYVIPNYKVRSK